MLQGREASFIVRTIILYTKTNKKRMKKQLLLAGLLLATSLTSLGMTAQSGQELTINGQTVEKTVARISFDGDNVILAFADETREVADMETVVLSFELSPVAIYELKSTVGDKLDLSGLEPGTEVTVYDAAGKKVVSGIVGHGHLQFSTKAMQKGIYMLKAGDRLVKFVKR